MKLYFSPGACSLSPHIVLRETGLPFELEQVDNKAKTTKSGEDFWKVNPKGYVPALRVDSGETLTEGPAIIQYLADQKPEAGLAPQPGTLERIRLQEWLNFITAELHKGFSPLFRPTTPEEYKLIARENLARRIGYVDDQLAAKPYLMGDQFSVADAYAFTVLTWTNVQKIDLGPYPHVRSYMERVMARPKVREAMKAEGLIR